MAKPVGGVTVKEVLQDFLAERGKKLPGETYRRFKETLAMLLHFLDRGDFHLLEEMGDALEGQGEKPSSLLFRPEVIPELAGEFLGHFMMRKVWCDLEQMEAAGSAVKELAEWLGQNGHISGEAAGKMQELGVAAARELPRAELLSELLFEFVETSPPPEGEEELDGLLTVTGVEPGKLYLCTDRSNLQAAVAVPEEISRLCRAGWRINLCLVQTPEGWRIAESGKVYPLQEEYPWRGRQAPEG